MPSPTVPSPTDAERLVSTTALALVHELQDEADRQRESSPEQARTIAWCADLLQDRATDTAWHARVARVARTPAMRPAAHPEPGRAAAVKPAAARPGRVRHLARHLDPIAGVVLVIPFLVLAVLSRSWGPALLFLLLPPAAAIIAHLRECGTRTAAPEPDGSEFRATG